MTVMVAVETTFEVTCPESEDIHENAERVMAALVELSESGVVLDGSVGADSERGEITIDVTVSAENLGDGVNAAITAMRNAVHAAGNATPTWPSHRAWMDMLVAQSMNAQLVASA